MTSMAYPQPYPVPQAPGFNQITRRMLTETEREFPVGVYRGAQRAARGVGIACLILFILNTFVLSAVITDQITLDTLSIMMSVFMGVFGLVGIGMAVNTLVVRKKVGDAMRDGMAIEVIGPAYRASTVGKVQSWTIGPISLMPTRDVQGMLMEGAPTSVLCVPRLKSAIAINNSGLRHGAKIMFPPSLEAMAVPMGMPAMPMGGQFPGIAYPSYNPGPVQAQPPQTASAEEIPPPPPPD